MLASRARTVHCRVGEDTVAELTNREQRLLDFERTWKLRGVVAPKGRVIRDELGVSPTSFYAALERLIDCAAAYAYDPLLIARLRRRRTARCRAAFDRTWTPQRRPR
jgi:hypothetical protein